MLNVLLVDDEPAARTAFRDLLPEGEGGYCLCGTVSNGQEALEFLRCSPVEVVVTDLKMPVMDGLTLIHRLKEKGFPGAILVLSNYSDFALVREALLSGAQDYILKVDMDQDSLREQLYCAVQKLGGPAALAPASRQETPPDSEGLLYRLLLVGAEAGEGPLPAAPYGLFVVRLEPAAGRRPVSEHSVRRVLESVLDNMESLQLQEKEYLCLASLPADNAGGTAATCACTSTAQAKWSIRRRSPARRSSGRRSWSFCPNCCAPICRPPTPAPTARCRLLRNTSGSTTCAR